MFVRLLSKDNSVALAYLSAQRRTSEHEEDHKINNILGLFKAVCCAAQKTSGRMDALAEDLGTNVTVLYDLFGD
jgi:hypothetical protein